MVLNIRARQSGALIKLLHFNEAFQQHQSTEELFKVLVIDAYTLNVVATLLHTEILRQHGVTLVLTIEKDRQAIADAPAVYFLKPTPENAAQIVADIESGLYKEVHLNFTPWTPRPVLEGLAEGAVKSASATRIAKIYDQYLSFIALEAGLFTLALPDSYLRLNDNRATEQDIDRAVSQIVEGLFSVCVTLGTVPVIRCAPGGLAEHVARALSAKLSDHLKGRAAALFAEASALQASLSRPILCLFDRNFDLIPMLEQPFTYKALVHDCLGLRLNKVQVQSRDRGGATGRPLSIEVGEDDAFWQQNGHQEFGFVAQEVDNQLKKYQEVMTSLTSRSAGSEHPDTDESGMIQEATKALLTTVKSLPELRTQKKKLDNHMNLLYALLHIIKERTLDKFHEVGQQVLSGTADFAAVCALLEAPQGSAADKLRLATLFLLCSEKLPGTESLARMTAALQAAGADAAAVSYVKRMRQMNLTGAAGASGAGAGGGAASGGNLLGLMDSGIMSGLAGQFSKQFTKFVGGMRQALIVSAVAQLMDGKPQSQSTSAIDDFVLLDPKAQAGKAGADAARGPFREAIVFVVGGGNYLERERLAHWAKSCAPPRNVIYGATELLTGAEFVAQLGQLGTNSGAA